MTDNTRLEPCPSPWCDHAAYVAQTDSDWFYGRAYQGRCTQCGLGGPVKRTEAEAIAAWNRREKPAVPDAGGPVAWLYDRVDWPNKGDVKPAISWDDPTPVLLDGDTGITNIRPLYALTQSPTCCEAERERCATIAETFGTPGGYMRDAGKSIATAIRGADHG